MRITGGKAKGITLISLQDKALRPATDYLRAALFSSLSSWVEGKVFLDLFAGTGSYGLEALSRGAESGVFIEKSGRTVDILRMNLQAVTKSLCRYPIPCKVFHHDVWTLSMPPEWQFDLIILDPPYNLSRIKAHELLSLAISHLRKADGSRICLEIPSNLEPPSHDSLYFMKRLGTSGNHSPSLALYELA